MTPIVPSSCSKSSRKADPKATLQFQLEKGLRLQVLPEFPFHPTRKWRFDFAIGPPFVDMRRHVRQSPENFLAVEIEGGLFLPSSGRHNRGAGMRADLEKYNEALILGWRVLRVLPEWCTNGKAFGLVERALKTGS